MPPLAGRTAVGNSTAPYITQWSCSKEPRYEGIYRHPDTVQAFQSDSEEW